MINPQTLKGFRDFLPIDARKRSYVLDILKKIFESYGFEPLETPALEYEDVLTGKYGDEGEKLMYKFEDNGGRKVAMRYDQTVPLARVVAQYKNNLSLPFKRYQIQNVWRAENTQKGRYREFLQVDIDTVGSSSLLSDGEIINMVMESYDKLGFKNAKIIANDRSVFEGIDSKAVRILDKLTKVGEEQAKKELAENGLKESLIDDLRSKPVPDNVSKLLEIFPKQIAFDPTLARGLDYYTGLIIEVEIEGYRGGSVGGGGRYDGLIGMFAGKDIPAVGFSFGFDRIIEAMEELDLFPKDLGGTRILITNTDSKAPQIAEGLRSKGINTELYVDDKELDKQLRYTDKKQIPYVLLFEGEDLVLKDMKTGEQKKVTLDSLPDAIR